MKSIILVQNILLGLLIPISLWADTPVDMQRLNEAGGQSRICYFSLNNKKEFESVDKFTKKLNKKSNHQIIVEEFAGKIRDPEKAFLEMVKEKVKRGQSCDGLVISGHHTGSFGGKQADGQLSIEFIEKLFLNETL